MGKKNKQNAEVCNHHSGLPQLYNDESCHVNTDLKTCVDKSAERKRAKKRKKYSGDNYHDVSVDSEKQDSTRIQKDHLNQEESSQNDSGNYVQTDTSHYRFKKHSRRHRQTGLSSIFLAEQEDVFHRCPSTEIIEATNKKKKKKRKKLKDSLQSNNKKCCVPVQVMNLHVESDSAVQPILDKQESSWLQVEHASGIKPEKRSKKNKYLQKKANYTFRVKNSIADNTTQDSVQKDDAENNSCCMKQKSLQQKMTEEKQTGVLTSFDIAESNTMNSNKLFDQESVQYKLKYSKSGSTEMLEKMSGSRKKKKHNKLRHRCIVSEKDDRNSLDAVKNSVKTQESNSNSNIGSCVKSGRLVDNLTRVSPVNCRDVDSNQQSTCSSKLGQWTNVQFDEPGRQSKFLQLLGGMKKSSLSTSFGNCKQLVPSTLEIPTTNVLTNVAMTAVQQQCVNTALERQFEKARDHSFRKRRGAGLGFDHPPVSGKTVSIDVGEINSKRLDDDN